MARADLIYVVRFAPTALTAAKTLIQIKAGAARLDILSMLVFQLTRTATEFWEIQAIVHTGSPTAATVTSFTPLPINPSFPAALAVGSTSATGVNATVEPSGGTANIMDGGSFNVLNGEWARLDIPEGELSVPQGKLFTLKLNTAPSASSSIGAIVKLAEYQ